MRILCIGDIVGKPGRRAVQSILPGLVRDRAIDVVIANGENAAGGSGLNPGLFEGLRRSSVDVVTMGDHVYRRRDIYPLLAESDRIVRPANLAAEATGRTFTVIDVAGVPVAVFCLLGRLHMKGADCPFHAADRVLASLPADLRVIVVDVHAEATGEKVALGHYLAGRASIVFGTHTHVPTADECILAGHTAYITDVGMTGPHDSVLGREKQAVIRSLVSSMPYTYDVAEGDVRLSGLLADVDSGTGAAGTVERIQVKAQPQAPRALADE